MIFPLFLPFPLPVPIPVPIPMPVPLLVTGAWHGPFSGPVSIRQSDWLDLEVPAAARTASSPQRPLSALSFHRRPQKEAQTQGDNNHGGHSHGGC